MAALPLAGACVPSPGPFLLPEVRGRVVDGDRGGPLPDALVVEAWFGSAPAGADRRPVYHARATRADDQGRFHLPRRLAPSPRMWLLRTYGPDYRVFHPARGLLGPRVTADAPGALRLEVPRTPPPPASELRRLCSGRPRDRIEALVARSGCSPAPAPAN